MCRRRSAAAAARTIRSRANRRRASTPAASATRRTTYTVDDTSTNGVARGGITNLTPNTESVEEVRVVSNNFSAVDGRSPGAQIQVITKAGTNQFRGSGSYYFQGDQLTAKNVFETVRARSSTRTSSATASAGRSSRTAVLLHVVRRAAADRCARLERSPSRRRSSATSSCRRARTASRRSCCGTSRRRSIRRPDFRDLGSPAPGVNTIGPPDGIMDVGTAFFVPEGWRDGNQFNARGDYELRPGKDRLYGNFYRTTSYAVTGRHPPGVQPADAEHHALRQRQLHAHVQLVEVERVRGGVMRLVGLPDVPKHLEIPGITISRRHRLRPVWLSERLVADELALQGHLHCRRSRAT